MARGRGGELQVCEINGGKRCTGCSTGIQVEIDWIVCGQFELCTRAKQSAERLPLRDEQGVFEWNAN